MTHAQNQSSPLPEIHIPFDAPALRERRRREIMSAITQAKSTAAVLQNATKVAAAQMDWQQVVLNGGPPCFYLCEDGHFCGRAQSWAGHEESDDETLHAFISLERLLSEHFNAVGAAPVTSKTDWEEIKAAARFIIGLPRRECRDYIERIPSTAVTAAQRCRQPKIFISYVESLKEKEPTEAGDAPKQKEQDEKAFKDWSYDVDAEFNPNYLHGARHGWNAALQWERSSVSTAPESEAGSVKPKEHSWSIQNPLHCEYCGLTYADAHTPCVSPAATEEGQK